MGVGIRMGVRGHFKSYIDIYTTANATVTATTSDKSFTGVANSSGYARIKVGKKGAYNITSTGTNRVGHATVINSTPVTAVYNWSVYNLNRYYTDDVKGSWGNNQYVAVYGATSFAVWTDYSFDSAPGQYSGAGSSRMTGSWPLSSSSRLSTPSCAIFNNGQMFQCTGGSYFRIGQNTNQVGAASAGSVMSLHEATYHQDKGSYYTQVSSSSLNGYPSDGIQDGYWYVAI